MRNSVLQNPRIEPRTDDSRANSVNHYILMSRTLKKLAKIKIPESGNYKPEALYEDLEQRIIEMSYEKLIEVSQAQTDSEFIKSIKSYKTKN